MKQEKEKETNNQKKQNKRNKLIKALNAINKLFSVRPSQFLETLRNVLTLKFVMFH